MVLYIVAGKLGWVRGVGVATTRQAHQADSAPAAV
jgi:cytosine permease